MYLSLPDEEPSLLLPSLFDSKLSSRSCKQDIMKKIKKIRKKFNKIYTNSIDHTRKITLHMKKYRKTLQMNSKNMFNCLKFVKILKNTGKLAKNFKNLPKNDQFLWKNTFEVPLIAVLCHILCKIWSKIEEKTLKYI